jgi:DNA-binding CsgD family transcriptional regulator
MTDNAPRPPPASLPAEQALLGLVLRGETTWPSELVTPGDFADAGHTAIALAMQTLADLSKPTDLPEVAQALDLAGRLGDVGGLPYLTMLAAGLAARENLVSYAGQIRQAAARRRAADAIARGDIGAARDHIEAAADGPGKAKVPATFTAAALGAMVFADPRWAVPDLLPEGLIILAGRPKMGKSWLALDISAAVAAGGYALGKVRVIQGEVLYLALEDRERRLRTRLDILLDEAAFPERLTFATTWPRGDAGVTAIRAWLDDHRDARLVVVDTLARFREPDKGNGSAYSSDYDALAGIQSLAVERGICVLMIHHLRKLAADDPMDTVSGTLGITGACDAVLVLARDRGAADAVLHVTGRDIEDAQHALRWEPASCLWTIIGDAAAVRVSQERREILDLLAAGPAYPKQIAEALNRNRGTIRRLLSGMLTAGEVARSGELYHLPVSSGNTPNRASPPHTPNRANRANRANTPNRANRANRANTPNRANTEGGSVRPCSPDKMSGEQTEPSNDKASRGVCSPVRPVRPCEHVATADPGDLV